MVPQVPIVWFSYFDIVFKRFQVVRVGMVGGLENSYTCLSVYTVSMTSFLFSYCGCNIMKINFDSSILYLYVSICHTYKPLSYFFRVMEYSAKVLGCKYSCFFFEGCLIYFLLLCIHSTKWRYLPWWMCFLTFMANWELVLTHSLWPWPFWSHHACSLPQLTWQSHHISPKTPLHIFSFQRWITCLQV